MTTERLFKVLGEGRKSCHGGTGAWPAPGEWLEVTGELVPCKHGLHLCREQDLVNWIGPEIWEAEYEGERVDGDDKIVVRKARLVRKCENWTERTARLFACDCAEHVLPLYEKWNPEDKRPRQTIEVARRYANGEATSGELSAACAARAAARAAAIDAAWAAAMAAACAARAAAWAAARDAARDAAMAAARAAARAAAIDAAWAAARDAERAARAAAWAAARDAERKWQTARLMDYIDGRAK
jgi:hypothetical protein